MSCKQGIRYSVGHVLIHFINNAFKESIASFREGADQDGKNVALAAGLLDATFVQRDDLSSNAIKQQIKEIKALVDSESNTFKALLFIIASHGNENVIFGTDREEVHVYEDIVRPLHNFKCEGLRGKPKIFLINACRGERGQDAIIYDGPHSSTNHQIATESLDRLVIRSERTGTCVQDIGDFALIYSTGPESVSVRDPEMGSPLIRNLFTSIQVLAESGQLNNTEFTEIFRNAQREVNLECGTSPGITNHLVKDVFLLTKGKH